MDVSSIVLLQQVIKKMRSFDPLSKDGVLFLQALSNDGKTDLVKAYERFSYTEDELS